MMLQKQNATHTQATYLFAFASQRLTVQKLMGPNRIKRPAFVARQGVLSVLGCIVQYQRILVMLEMLAL